MNPQCVGSRTLPLLMNSPQTKQSDLVLLTGVTGYVGGRLLPLLESRGQRVRCLHRRVNEFTPSHNLTEAVQGDLLDPESLPAAFRGVHTAFYLVHSLGDAADFEAHEAQAATNFARAAVQAGVQKIVYLGGLFGEAGELSAHSRSRLQVGRILRDSGIPTIEFRASVIVGSGSLSFEMIRALVERLPIMVTPRWVGVEAQPIAIADVLAYLLAALKRSPLQNEVFEIGGADRVTYGELMLEYGRQRGLRRWMIRVPVLTPRLSSLWLGLVTPLYARVGRKLVESIRHPSVVNDTSAHQHFDVRPVGAAEAITQAIRNEDREFALTRWSDAISSAGTREPNDGRRGNRLIDARSLRVAASPDRAFQVIERIGGDQGWYACDWLWQLRGFLDLLIGGVGVRRGRRDPRRLKVGESLDFWRVEVVDRPHQLRLHAEMKVPGRAWLEFRVEPDSEGCTIHQVAWFDPQGLFGLVYWYLLMPIHEVVFQRMIEGLAGACAEPHTADADTQSEASQGNRTPRTPKASEVDASVERERVSC